MDDILWIEAWIDRYGMEYVLILRELGAGVFQIVDPQDFNQVVINFEKEKAAVAWLDEEGYDRLSGRYFRDGDSPDPT